MKRLIQIVFLSIALIYLTGMSYQLFIFVDFKVHQEEVIAEHCVNKDKPELHCNGHCHLKKQMEETIPDSAQAEESESQNSPNLDIFFFMGYEELGENQLGMFSNDADQLRLVYLDKSTNQFKLKVWTPPRA